MPRYTSSPHKIDTISLTPTVDYSADAASYKENRALKEERDQIKARLEASSEKISLSNAFTKSTIACIDAKNEFESAEKDLTRFLKELGQVTAA